MKQIVSGDTPVVVPRMYYTHSREKEIIAFAQHPETLSLQHVADAFHISRERVRQVLTWGGRHDLIKGFRLRRRTIRKSIAQERFKEKIFALKERRAVLEALSYKRACQIADMRNRGALWREIDKITGHSNAQGVFMRYCRYAGLDPYKLIPRLKTISPRRF